MTSPTAIADIKRLTDLPPLFQEYGIKLIPCAGGYKCLCPFHGEKTPSLMIHTSGKYAGTWKCFGCSQGGDAFTFFQLIEKIPFHEALKQLADRCGVPLDNKPVSRALAATEREDRAMCLWWWARRREMVLANIYAALADEDEPLAECCANVRRWMDEMPAAEKLHYFRCHVTAAERREYAGWVREERLFAEGWMEAAGLYRDPRAGDEEVA